MKTTKNYWLHRLGFYVWHVPGVSRAWRYDLARGYVLVTDLEGYDLPEPRGPYAGLAFSSQGELIDVQPWLIDAPGLFRWFRHILRLCAAQSKRIDSTPGQFLAVKRLQDRQNRMR